MGQWSHNTHKVEKVEVHYPWHPLYNQEKVTVLKTFKRGGKTYYYVGVNHSKCILLPRWMTDKIYCQKFILQDEAYCSVAALLSLRRLLDVFDQ